MSSGSQQCNLVPQRLYRFVDESELIGALASEQVQPWEAVAIAVVSQVAEMLLKLCDLSLQECPGVAILVVRARHLPANAKKMCCYSFYERKGEKNALLLMYLLRAN